MMGIMAGEGKAPKVVVGAGPAMVATIKHGDDEVREWWFMRLLRGSGGRGERKQICSCAMAWLEQTRSRVSKPN